VALAAQTFDESANRTGRYHVVATLEPRELIGGRDLPPLPIKWPPGRRPPPDHPGGPLGEWEGEVPLHLDPESKTYSLAVPLVEALTAGSAGQAFRVELTAYEGEGKSRTQIDSGSLEVQVLSDPHEQQNPLPNREFLAALAQSTGGREFSDAGGLGDALKDLPVAEGPQTVRRTPLWSRE